MSTRELAHGLASLGRHGDSVLVHMQPEEVSGLQTLARANGTSLTINPNTGMPEAFNLGRALKSVAKVALPIAAGWALGPGGLTAEGIFSSSLGAGLAVGAGAYALTGDPMYALSSGLGGAGGFGLGQNVSTYGNYIKSVPEMGVKGAEQAVKLGDVASGGIDSSIAGLKGLFGARPEGAKSYFDFMKDAQYISPVSGELIKPSLWQDVATVGMPVLTAMGQQRPSNFGLPAQETLNYEGPYKPSPRNVRMPTAAETEQMRLAGSPEYTYFDPSNPIPGYQPFAEGGSIQAGGIRDLYGNSDDQMNGATLSRDGYGLGRLNAMASMQMAGGGPVSFEAGGQIPGIASVAAPQQMPIPDMAQMAQPQMQAPDTTGINTLLGQAVRDPLGRGMAKGGYLDGPGDGMSDSIPATIAGKQPARLADGEFVVPADVVSHLGNGSTKAGAKHLYKMMDRVRQARTGTKKQGRQINPNKLMPA